MKPEELETIALGMGYEAWVCVNEVYKGQVRIKLTGILEGVHKEYSPLTNDTQLTELHLKALDEDWIISKEGDFYQIFTPTIDDIIMYQDKDYRKMLCIWALAYFKNEV